MAKDAGKDQTLKNGNLTKIAFYGRDITTAKYGDGGRSENGGELWNENKWEIGKERCCGKC